MVLSVDHLQEEGLRDWFGKSKSKDGKKGWVNVVTGDSCASDKPGEGIPKCVSSAKRASMSKKERRAAAAAKRRKDPGQQQKRNAAAPTNVKTDRKIRKEEMELCPVCGFNPCQCLEGTVSEAKDKPGKGSGKKDACYHKVKSRYDVWPSAYASGALVKCRKAGAKNWGNKSEGYSFRLNIDEKCWKGYTQKGLKKKGDRMVPNCVKEVMGMDEWVVPALAAGAAAIGGGIYLGKKAGEFVDKHRKTKPSDYKNKTGLGAYAAKARNAGNVNTESVAPGPILPFKEKGKRVFPKGQGPKPTGAQLPPLQRSGFEPEGEVIDEASPTGYNKGERYTGKAGAMSPKEIEKANEGSAERIRKTIPIKLANSYEPDGEIVEAAETIHTSGQTYRVILNWRSKVLNMTFFFPGAQRPTEEQMKAAVEKVYPGAQLYTFMPAINDPTKPIIVTKENSMCGQAITIPSDREKARKNYLLNIGVIGEGAAWTRKEGQNSKGGLNEKGRKSYEKANPGSDLKAPSKKVGNPRRASFCARMKGMKKKLTSKKTASDPNSRINKSLRAWNC